MTPLTIFRVASLGAIAAFGVACVVQDGSPGYTRGGSSVASPPPPADSAGSTSPAAIPIVVVLDTGKTMNAAPGGGVGVFTEYAAGGHWHIWWTCDSSAPTSTHQSCAFDVRIHTESGAAHVQSSQFAPGDALVADDAQTLHATTVTSTNVSSLAFDTDPGASVRVTASMDGVADAAFFFFVQEGKVNGGFQGSLTDPLLFQPSRP